MVNKFIAFLTRRCLLCKARAMPGIALCQACFDDMPWNNLACQSCGLPLLTSARHCGECIARQPIYDACHTALRYAFPADRILQLYKSNGKLHFGRLLTSLLVHSTAQSIPTQQYPDAIVPVPLSPEKHRQRGFNQNTELAYGLAQLTQAPVINLLQARQHTEQKQLSRSARLRAPSFLQLAHKTRDIPTTIWLVDDVITTGATMNQASKKLKNAGCKTINAIAALRTPKPGST